jgi:hypothetical protein
MSVIVNGNAVNLVHVRHDGRSHDVYTEDLTGLAGDTNQQQFIQAVEAHLDLSVGSLTGYELDIVAATQTAVVRPQAKFGII